MEITKDILSHIFSKYFEIPIFLFIVKFNSILLYFNSDITFKKEVTIYILSIVYLIAAATLKALQGEKIRLEKVLLNEQIKSQKLDNGKKELEIRKLTSNEQRSKQNTDWEL